MRAWMSAILVLTISVGMLGQVAQGAVPHPGQAKPTAESRSESEDDPSPTAVPTVVATAESGGGQESGSDADCEGLPDYYRELNKAVLRAKDFNQFLDDDAVYEDLTTHQAQGIVDDADTLIESISALDVPTVYADGNEGIILLFGLIRDQVAFYGLDTSSVPKVGDYDIAIQHIYDGETLAAETCPKEVDDLGGFLFIDPADIEDQVDTGD